MNALTRDLRHAARTLLMRPTFFLTAVLTLTLGIGAVAAIFTVYDAVLLKPLPFAHADRIVRVTREQPPASRSTISAQAFEEWRERSGEAFDAIGAFVVETRNLTSAGEAQRLTVYKVTPGFWNVFGQPLALGRAFGDAEEQHNERVVVLGDALWRTRFGGDAAVIGRDIALNGESFRVVGVAAATFRYPADAQVWIPTFLPGNTTRTRGMNYLRPVARLRDGVSLAQAKAVMRGISDWQARTYPDEHAGMSAGVTPLKDLLSGDVRRPLQMLLIAAALVLLIACANLANLMLARGQTREHELALRSALGAGQTRLVRQVLAESLLIAIAGAAAGLALARPAIVALTALAPDLLPAYNAPAIDLRVIATTAAVALATLLLFGLLPAWRAAQSDPLHALRGASRSQTGSRAQVRARCALVSAEIALALTLLAGASLLIGSLRQLGKVESGIGSPQVLTAAFSVSLPAQQPGDVAEEWAARAIGQLAPRLDAIEQRLRALPSVAAVALANRLPASGDWGWNSRFTIPGRALDDKALAEYRFVSADYFRTFGIPVEAGRAFTATDGAASLYPTEVLVNQAFADRYLARLRSAQPDHHDLRRPAQAHRRRRRQRAPGRARPAAEHGGLFSGEQIRRRRPRAGDPGRGRRLGLRRTAAARDARDRARRAGVLDPHDGRGDRRDPAPARVQHDPDERVRRRCAAARRDRPVRRDRVLGRAPPPRDRRAPGARRRRRRHPPADPRRRPAHDRARHRAGTARRARARPPDRRAALRRRRGRSVGARRHGDVPGRRGAGGLRDSRPACEPRAADGGPAQ